MTQNKIPTAQAKVEKEFLCSESVQHEDKESRVRPLNQVKLIVRPTKNAMSSQSREGNVPTTIKRELQVLQTNFVAFHV